MASDMHEFLKDDYNLEALEPVQPAGDGFSMYVTPRFVATYARGYETLSTRIVKRHLARQDLFIDVGAHYGYYSLLAAAANPDLRIVSVEPIEDNLRVLRKNLASNGIGPDRATTLHAAVSARAGRVRFCKSEASDNGSLYPHPSSETLARIEVDAVCLDDVVGAEPPRRIFVKTDTDGHELEVLKGFVRTLAACADVTILMEMNPKMMKIAGTGTPEILAFLHAQGFRVFAIDDGESRLYPLDQAGNVAMLESRYETSYYNVICVRKSLALSVAFFSHSAQLAGAERSLLDLVRGLTGRGVLCSAVLPAEGPLRDELIQTGCAVHVPLEGMALARGWWWANRAPGPSRAALASGLDMVAHAVLPEIRKLAPDVVFSQTIVSPWGAWCAEALGLPHVLSAREYGELDHHMAFTLGFQPSLAALYASSESALCITADVRDVLFGADSDRKTVVVYGGVEMPAVAEASAGPPPDPATAGAVPTICLMGTVVASKGQADLVRAGIELARRNVAFRVRIVGTLADPAYAAALRCELETAGCADRFVWEDFTREPAAVLRQAEVVVSCARREALGRTLLEAAWLERPVVYADAGGPREIFTAGEHGLAYPPGDPLALADALEAVLRDPAAAFRRARQAKEYVLRHFNDEAYAGKIHDVLRTVAAGPGRPHSGGTPVRDMLRAAGLDFWLTEHVRPKLYYADAASGFNDGAVRFHDEIPWGPFRVDFEVPADGATCLRFDPAELCAVELAIHELRIVAADGSVLSRDQVQIEANGEPGTGLSWTFPTLDPNLVLKSAVPVRKISIVGELKKLAACQLLAGWDAERQRHLRDLDATTKQIGVLEEICTVREGQIAQLGADLQVDPSQLHEAARRLGAERQAALQALADVYRSKSWQLTAPLRGGERVVRKACRGALALRHRLVCALPLGAQRALHRAYARVRPLVAVGAGLVALPFRLVQYALHPGLRAKALNALARRWAEWRQRNRLVVLPDLDWVLQKLELDVDPGQIAARIGPYLTRPDEAVYGAMIGALRAAATGSAATVVRAGDLEPPAAGAPARRRILFVCGEFPNPVHGGGGRVADFIKALGADHDVFVGAWYDRLRDPAALAELEPHCRGLLRLSFEDLEAGCAEKLLGLLDGQPADVVHYEWPRALNSFDRRLGRHHVYTHMEAVSCSLWIDLRRLAPLSPDWLRRLAQLLVMLKTEILDVKQADAQIVVTAKDGEFLSRFASGQTFYVVNHGINRAEFDVPDQPAEPRSLVFTGNFIHYPNVDAVHWFMRDVRPRILAAVPDLRVWLVGAHPPADLQRYHDGAGVVVTGRVADVRPWIQKAAVCIAPLVSGAGLRTKVVQYAALRRPCVATSIAVEDLGFENGRDVFVADAPDAFADRVVELLLDPARAAALVASARRRALDVYDNHRIAARDLGNLYRRLDAGKEPR
ncbi:MAG: FkbM family methyltransferase [Kiritimatiellia bacterium]